LDFKKLFGDGLWFGRHFRATRDSRVHLHSVGVIPIYAVLFQGPKAVATHSFHRNMSFAKFWVHQ
jgi:hypothetical protein